MFQTIGMIIIVFFLSSTTKAGVAPLAVGESIDDFFGRISYGVTGRSCDEAGIEEYLGFRCGLGQYFYSNESTFGSGSNNGNNFFQGVTDSIVFNTAADSVHSMNQCQVSFYDRYFKDVEARNDLQTRSVASFNEIRGLVRQRKKRIIEVNTATVTERVSLPCFTSAECAMMTLSLESRPEEALERDSRLTELLASVPMGNRPQMRNYLLSVADKNIDETTFRSGYDKVMRELEAEANTSFNTIHAHYRKGSDGKHYFNIDSDLRRSLINNGIVGNIIAEHGLEDFASSTNFMCRIDRRNEGMWVGAGGEVVLALAAAFVSRGATAEVTPYVLASMRTGSILRRLAAGEKLLGGAASGLSKSTTAKLLLYGAAHTVEAMMTYKDVSENCFGPEYLASLSNEGCSAESQMYNVKAEASIAACAVSATLGVALPVSMVALNRVGPRGARIADEIIEDADVVPVPTRALTSNVTPEPDAIVVSAGKRREFALAAQQSTQLGADLSARGIKADTVLIDEKLLSLTPNERIFLVESIADTALTPAQARSIIDIVAHAQRRGLQQTDINRLIRVLRESGVDSPNINAIITRLRHQRVLESAPNSPTVTYPIQRTPQAPIGPLPKTESALKSEYSTRVITTPAENKRYLQATESSSAQPDTIVVDSQNVVQKIGNDETKDKALIDALNNRHSLMLIKEIQELRSRFPNLVFETYSDYKGVRFAIRGSDGRSAELAQDLERVMSDVDQRFMKELENANYPTITERIRNNKWFFTSSEETADWANLLSRTGLTRAQIEEKWGTIRTLRKKLEERFPNSPIMRRVQGDVHAFIPTSEVFELLRKNPIDSEVAKILNHRHGIDLEAVDISNFREYAKEVDVFSPNLRINERVTHNFDSADSGGITLDFGGVGSLNAEATAEGLAQGFSPKRSVMNIRRNEQEVTAYLDQVKKETETAVSDVLLRHNITSTITTSGDDMVVVPNAPITDSIKNEILQAQARAQADLLKETGRNTNVRVSYFSDNIVNVADRSVIAVEGEGIEKILRGRLEFLIPQSDLKRLTIGTDMLGSSHGTGAITLRTNGVLTPAQNAILEREFRAAVADANKPLGSPGAMGTQFTIAP